MIKLTLFFGHLAHLRIRNDQFVLKYSNSCEEKLSLLKIWAIWF